MQNNLDKFYVALENKFRGEAELIRERQMVYIPLIKHVVQAVDAEQQYDFIDIGCGRGEWMNLLRENGVRCRGIDTNAEMIGLCRSISLDVFYGDALAYFRKLPDNCLAGVSAFHVVEHLDLETSLSLLAEIHRCLVNGGVVFFETPNPENFSVGSHTFYIDPTHTKPIPPVLLSFMFEFCGFMKNEIIRLHPISRLSEGEIPTAALAHMLHHFFCAQDYAVVGFKGEDTQSGALACLPGHQMIESPAAESPAAESPAAESPAAESPTAKTADSSVASDHHESIFQRLRAKLLGMFS